MEDKKGIRWGILGAGDVAEVKSGPAFQKANNSELVAVMRRNEAKAKDFAERHKVPKWYSQADQLLDDPNIDAIYIATPPRFHKEYAIKVLQKGKYVYLEKPVALNLKESEEILAVQKETKGKICVAHYRRALDAFLHVESLIEKGAIGEVRFARITILQPLAAPIVAKTDSDWRTDPALSGGGLFHDLSPHEIDLMIKWFGNPIQINGISTNRSNHSKADDLVVGEFLCESGVVVQGTWCFSVAADQSTDRCDIFGSDGTISFSFYADKVSWSDKAGFHEEHFKIPENVQLPMIQKAVNYFLDTDQNPCSLSDGIQVMKVLDQFTEAK